MSSWGGERPVPGWAHSVKQEGFCLPLRKKETYLEETVTSFWLLRNFLMLNFFYRRWNYNTQSYLFLVVSTVHSTFKEQSGAEETNPLCASRQFALFCGVQSMLGFSKGNKTGDFLMQIPSSSFIKNESVFLRVEMSCPSLHSSIVSCLRQSLFINSHFPIVLVQSLSPVWLFCDPWTVALQAPLPMDFPGKNSGVDWDFLLQGIFPN